jgi:hypothetical protein
MSLSGQLSGEGDEVVTSSQVVMEEVTDPQETAGAKEQHERFQRNVAWLRANAAEVYSNHRGKYLCIAGQELFVGDTAREAFTAGAAAHPEDDGSFVQYVPRDVMARIYADSRRMVSLS